MPYSPNFPINYQPAQIYYPQPQPQPQTQAASASGIIWVQGEAGAKSYLVAPNTTVQLWDSERQTVYLKSADASGMPSMKVLDYTIRNEAQPQTTAPVVTQEYAMRADVDELTAQINALRADIDGLKKKKEATTNEQSPF